MSITIRALGFWKRLTWFGIAAGVISLIAVLVLGSFYLNLRTRKALSKPAERTEQRHSSMEVEIVTATRRGFDPLVISRPKGKFILMVTNRSGDDLDFRFSRQIGESVHEIKSSRQELDWNEIVDLTPG